MITNIERNVGEEYSLWKRPLQIYRKGIKQIRRERGKQEKKKKHNIHR